MPTLRQALPVGWVEKRLKFAAPLRTERAEATSEHSDYLGLENIQSWTGKLIPAANSESVADEDSAGGTASRFCKGDVLFCKLRPYLAKALLANEDGVCTTELLVLTPELDLSPQFLLYTILSPEFIGQVDASTFGTKMPRANWDFIGSMKVPVPSLDVQSRITDYLDRETSRMDALVVEKERMLALLEKKRAAIIRLAITRGLEPNVPLKPSGIDWLGDIPKHWDVLRIKHGFKIIGSGTTPPTNQEELYDGDIPWVTTSELRENVVTATDKHVSKDALREFSALKLYSEGTVLFAMYGATIGRVAMLGVAATVNQAVCALASPDRFFGRYVFYALQVTRDILVSLATGGGQPNLNAEKVREHKLPCPPLDEQQAIADFLYREISRFDEIVTEVINSIEKIKKRRAALITAAVTGQISLEERT